MRSAIQYLVRWTRGAKAFATSGEALLKRRYGARPGTRGAAVGDFQDRGFSAAILADEPYVHDHLAWTADRLVVTSGSPAWKDGKPAFAAEILAACEAGPGVLGDVLAQMSGGFSLAAFFAREETLCVVRDRFGLVPVYTAAAGDDLAVGTGPRTAAEALGRVSPNLPSLARYILFRYGETAGHEPTCIQGAFLVPPATILRFGRRPERQRYWSFETLDRSVWPDKEPLEARCREHLLQSTRQAVFGAGEEADRSIIALSSGMDSSSVAAACHKLGRPLAAFTARYDADVPVNEFEAARGIAEKVCRDWRPVVIGPEEFLEAWKQAYRIHELPLATSACLGYDLLTRKVADLGFRRIVTGGSGDDLFAGNYPCYLHHLADLFVSQSPRFEPEFEAWVRLHGTAQFPKDAGVLWAFLMSHVDLSERGAITPKPQLLDGRFTRAGALGEALASVPPVRLNAGGYLASLTAYGYWYCMKQPGLLPISEGMWHLGAEFLDPFLNEAFFEFAWKLPSEWKIRDGYNKVLLRRVVKDLLPPETAGRAEKVGFDVPFQPWSARPDYREFMADLFQSPEAREVDRVVDVGALRGAVTGEQSASVSPMLVWQAANAILWLQAVRE